MRSLSRRALAHDFSPHRVCRSCLLQSRRSISVSLTATPPPRPPSAGLAALPSRQLISVAGTDAAKFLQGIVTANVLSKQGLPRTDGFYTGFLNATGRVLHDVFVYPFQKDGFGVLGGEDGFLIEIDAAQMNALARFIKRYKLRAKVNVRALTADEANVWQAWDDAAPLEIGGTDSRIVLRDPRAPGLGFRILQYGSSKTPELDLDRSTEDAYTIRRYLHGVAEGQDEVLKEQALPLECNMEYMNGIDFHKGCYVGQELTIRTKHRGVVRKRILPCVIYEEDKGVPQALIYEPEVASPESLTADMIPAETSIGRSGKRGRSAGKWLKGVGNIGLGLCRLEIMTDVVLPGEQAAATFTPDNEFSLEWGEVDSRKNVKVKAFVPDWLRRGMDGQ
ncbi:putative transferase CAF17 [Escovopsis weberi]|uniref:Iron-sulfur cluster assembly factor IBA57 homolog, mitochondrial n=1 Tax=Escovopsis weberi TaxID=150374 RepID=A0A0M8N8Y3_ESCWE|nr:putative transferase CAF17 [Escovopsis weberi]